MKATLYKVLDQYHLYDGDKAIATTIVGNPMLLPNLSKQNCDEIFGVTDVEMLAKEESYKAFSQTVWINGFKAGFNKAMELNKDKLFTLEQMSVAYNTNRSGTLFEQLINSFGGQPTEIDVEIVMEVVPDFYSRSDEDGSIFTSNKKEQSKLDSEGNLILKKINNV